MLYFYLMVVGILAFIAIFYRLITTNHWTAGKKLLVGLVSAILVGEMGMITAIAFGIKSLLFLILIKFPLVLVAGVMAYCFYNHEVIVE